MNLQIFLFLQGQQHFEGSLREQHVLHDKNLLLFCGVRSILTFARLHINCCIYSAMSLSNNINAYDNKICQVIFYCELEVQPRMITCKQSRTRINFQNYVGGICKLRSWWPMQIHARRSYWNTSWWRTFHKAYIFTSTLFGVIPGIFRIYTSRAFY